MDLGSRLLHVPPCCVGIHVCVYDTMIHVGIQYPILGVKKRLPKWLLIHVQSYVSDVTAMLLTMVFHVG